MTEIFPINNAREQTGNGRRVYTTQSLSDVAHLATTAVSPSLYVTHGNKQEAFIVNMLLPIHERGVKESSQKDKLVSELRRRGSITVGQVDGSRYKNHQINGDVP